MAASFGTKAETLARLAPKLKRARILPQFSFQAAEWAAEEETVTAKALKRLGTRTRLIVRSSSLSEDGAGASNAGRFASVAGVRSGDKRAFADAVRRVLESYGPARNGKDQVLVQPFLENVKMSGVLFTRDLDTLAPYYVINYDDVSGRTDTVTSGHSNDLKTRVIFRGHKTRDKRFAALLSAVREVEKCLSSDRLDIEFALDGSGKVYIFQARPIAAGTGGGGKDEAEIARYLEKLHKKIVKLNRPHPYVYGRRTLLGVMPDWNPAEMLGIKPRTLALSLYKELITDRTWAYQRDNYGYKNLRSYPLMTTLLGHPYIDSRVSFNSFIPKNVDERLSARLSDYYLDCLEKSPECHDKVEFDIVFSCAFPGIDRRLDRLRDAGFGKKDVSALSSALKTLTKKIVASEGGVFHSDLAKIGELEKRRRKVLDSSLTDLEKIYWLIEDCRRYGTLPFAGLARAGFIAVQMMKALVDEGVLTQDQFSRFMASLNTVAKRMASDRAKLGRSDFLKLYGHLRPGTYDILSPRYDEAYDSYFAKDRPKAPKVGSFSFDAETLSRIGRALKTEGLGADAGAFVDFVRRAIEGREHSKFVFTRSVSDVLNLVKRLASRYKIGVDDASFLDIRTLLGLYSTLDHRDLGIILQEEIKRNRFFYEVTKGMRLPALIASPDDIYEFELEAGSPNFITLGRCRAETAAGEDLKKESLKGKIVCIPSADPGYDWIFTRRIAGLVTMYGGANSHMAIRSAEMRIPAVIGAGEKNYGAWTRARMLEIDCANRQVKVIR